MKKITDWNRFLSNDQEIELDPNDINLNRLKAAYDAGGEAVFEQLVSCLMEVPENLEIGVIQNFFARNSDFRMFQPKSKHINGFMSHYKAHKFIPN